MEQAGAVRTRETIESDRRRATTPYDMNTERIIERHTAGSAGLDLYALVREVSDVSIHGLLQQIMEYGEMPQTDFVLMGSIIALTGAALFFTIRGAIK